MQEKAGFTLIELMIVVCVIGILAAIAVPKYSETIRRSQEARTKGNLASLRSAITSYYSTHEGRPPIDRLDCLVSEGILNRIPLKSTPPYHPEGNTVSAGNMSAQTDAKSDWFYVNDSADPRFGEVMVNCIHLTIGGQQWDRL
jgi:prepilin-type N-terminal cleavage/methylation domain-containing protein